MDAPRTFLLVQVLRGVAALMVVWHHTTMMESERLGPGPNPVHGPWLPGAAGVDLFFVISGFVMVISSASLRAAAHPVRVFVARRMERVVPLYWLMTTVKIALALLFPALGATVMSGAWHIVSSYLFLASLNALGAAHPVLIVGWTLNYEMFFYVVLAAGLALRLRLIPYLTVMLGLLALLGWRFAGYLPVVLWTANPLMLEFLYGVLLAGAVRRLDARRGWQKGLCLAMLGLGVATIVTHPEAVALPNRFLEWGLPATAIVGGALGLESWLGGRAPRWMLGLGNSSYSIYLTHTITLSALGWMLVRWRGLDRPGGGIVDGVVCAGICLAVAEASYRGLELPLIRYFKRGREMKTTKAA